MVYLIRINFKKLRIKNISKIIVLRKDLVKMKSSLKNPLISIIVPVFNVKNYIEKCILSLINQTYENIEIILVDDGSSDGSEIVCDKFRALGISRHEHGLAEVLRRCVNMRCRILCHFHFPPFVL